MDLKQIEKLMAAMERNGMKRVALKQKDFEIELEKECAMTSTVLPALHAPPTPREKEEELHIPPEGDYMQSPMVGTFYSAPSPEDAPFVKVGDQVDEDTVGCIIEAMKVMNEVKVGVKGTIAEILVKNGDPVEFGTKIFKVV